MGRDIEVLRPVLQMLQEKELWDQMRSDEVKWAMITNLGQYPQSD